LYSDTIHLAQLLEAGVDPELLEGLKPRWKIGPMSRILGVWENSEGERTLGAFRWGLVPGWAKDPSAVRSTFNARAETVATKPTFRSAFKRWRILVPVDAFYEWKAGTPSSHTPSSGPTASPWSSPVCVSTGRVRMARSCGRPPSSRLTPGRTCRSTIGSRSCWSGTPGSTGSIPRGLIGRDSRRSLN